MGYVLFMKSIIQCACVFTIPTPHHSSARKPCSCRYAKLNSNCESVRCICIVRLLAGVAQLSYEISQCLPELVSASFNAVRSVKALS